MHRAGFDDLDGRRAVGVRAFHRRGAESTETGSPPDAPASAPREDAHVPEDAVRGDDRPLVPLAGGTVEGAAWAF